MGRSPLLPCHDEAQAKALRSWAPEACDATTLIQLVRKNPPREIPIDRERLAEARRIADEVRAALGLPRRAAAPSLDRAALLEAVIRVCPELAYVRRAKRRHALGNGVSEVEEGRETRLPEKAEAAVVFDLHSLPGRGTRQTLNFATCMAPVPLSTLAALQLGEVTHGEPRWEKGTLMVEQQRLYAGRVIASKASIPQGAVARRALTRLILDNRLLKGAAEQARRDIDAWNLYLSLGEAEGEPALVGPWLEQRLAELGVEAADDLALIEPKDLGFDGIPEWQRAEFDQRYPLQLKLENMPVKVIYEPKRRRITLERSGGKRRTPPRRIELPHWSGWRVYFKDASRVIALK